MFDQLKHRLGRRRSAYSLDPVAFDSPRREEIPVDRLLVGSQAGRPLEAWIEETGDYDRASLRLIDSSYVSFLNLIREDPERLENDSFLRSTDYFRMAHLCAASVGKWFGAKEDAGILERVRAFGKMLPELEGDDQPDLQSLGGEALQGKTQRGDPIRVFSIRNSCFYELQDGHHRAALTVLSDKRAIDALVLGEKWTALQRLVLQGVQTRGRMELYQPIDAPEFDGDWKLVRRCTDRFSMMERFLKESGIEGKTRSMLDLASSYGWFLKAFSDLGFTSHGVERDAVAVKIGRAAYRLGSDAVRMKSVERFLKRNRDRFDIVLFLSILHHFVIGRESTGWFSRSGDAAARKILSHVDRACGHVLFFDTGQEHETWMKEKLPGWNPDFISRWLRENSTFDEIVPLGTDEDVKTYPGNYARTLFACVRARPLH